MQCICDMLTVRHFCCCRISCIYTNLEDPILENKRMKGKQAKNDKSKQITQIDVIYMMYSVIASVRLRLQTKFCQKNVNTMQIE